MWTTLSQSCCSRLIALGVGLSVLITSACAARSSIRDSVFEERIEQYLSLRSDAVREVGRVGEDEDPSDILEDVVELRTEIRMLRQNAREGDLLGGPVATNVRAWLRKRLDRNDGKKIVEEIFDTQPEPFTLQINVRYPGGEPRASTPTAVLRTLPRLPSQLEYRFVGRDLLLLDRPTGLVLDVLREALPVSVAAG